MPLRTATQADYQRRVLLAQMWLEARLDEPIDIATLARVSNFSLHHFHRIFSAQTGESIMQYVRRLRLERAARTLRHSDVRLLDLAVQAGYDSHEPFTRAFVDRFGIPPSHFRDAPSARLEAWKPNHVDHPKAQVRVETFPALRVACMRHRGGYLGINAVWDRLRTWARARDLMSLGPSLYGICPDDPDVTDEPRLRFDACVVVGPDRDAAFDDQVIEATVPAGTYAVGLHVGPYSGLSDTYLDVIGHWFPTSGYELAPDAVVEHYLNDPSNTPVAELCTEVRVRIADQSTPTRMSALT